MKKKIPFVALLSLVGVAACEKEPEPERMDGEYFVGTVAHGDGAFGLFSGDRGGVSAEYPPILFVSTFTNKFL